MGFFRAWVCLGGVAALGGLLAAACGGDPGGSGASASEPDASGPADGGGPSVDASGGPSVDGPLTLRDRLAGWSSGYTGGWYQAHGYAVAGKRLFSLPDALSPSLGAVTVVDVAAPKPRVYSLPVVGKFPAGSVEAFVYDRSIDRVALILRPLAPSATKNGVEVVTIALGDKEATFTTLTQAGPISASNSMIGPLYAAGGGVIVAGLGNTTASFTIAGTTATWAAESSGTIFAGNTAKPVEDPAHGRVLAFGKSVYDPGTKTVHVEPNVLELTLAAPYTWSALPFSGDAPPLAPMTGSSFLVNDAKGGRVFVSAMHDTTCGSAPCTIPGLWSFDLGTHAWHKLEDFWSSPHAYGSAPPFLVDDDARRMLEPSDGVLLATPLDTATNPTLADAPLVQDGDLGPSSPLGAAVLGDQRIVSTDGRAFRVLDPTSAAPRWERFGTATMPSSLYGGVSISADTRTGEVLVFGTPQGQGAQSELHVLASDGKALSKVSFTSGPPPRTYHGALVVEGTLYVAGGTSGPAPGTPLDDVWAFDRATSAWSKIATLPTGVAYPTLGLGPTGELLVMGRVPGAQGGSVSSKLFAIDRRTHAVRAMDAMPAKDALWSMTPYRGCFLGYESGNTVDTSRPTVWRCSIANGVSTWTSTTLEEHDFTIRELRGATSPDGLHAYFVGRHLWEAIGK